MKTTLKQCGQGLFWASLVFVTLFVHYAMCVDVPEFRYMAF